MNDDLGLLWEYGWSIENKYTQSNIDNCNSHKNGNGKLVLRKIKKVIFSKGSFK